MISARERTRRSGVHRCSLSDHVPLLNNRQSFLIALYSIILLDNGMSFDLSISLP